MMNRRPYRRRGADRGAVAVEFALLLPVLLLIIFGVIDFGRMLNAQVTITQAAREGARLDALGDTADVQQRTQAAATGLGTNVAVTVVSTCPTDAGPGVDAQVEAQYQFSFVTPIGAFVGLFGTSGLTAPLLTAEGVMPCET